MKRQDSAWLILIFLTPLVMFISCKDKIQEKTKDEWLKNNLSKVEGLYAIGESEKSFDEAKEKMRDNISLKIVNSLREYLGRIQTDFNDEINTLVRERLIEQLSDPKFKENLKNLAEFREKYYDKPNHKFYALGVITTEKLTDFITTNFSGFYNSEIFYRQLKERPGGIYRIRVNSRYSDRIISLLSKDGLTLDNTRWFAEVVGHSEIVDETSIASLSGPLYTIKAQYLISIKGKNGILIGQLTSNVGKGVSNSKSKALSKAIVNTSIDIEKISTYTTSIKENIDNYIKEWLNKKFNESIADELGRIQGMFQTGDYSLAETSLEKVSISSKEFPQALAIYLKIQAKKEKDEQISATREETPIESVEERETKWFGELVIRFILGLLGGGR